MPPSPQDFRGAEQRSRELHSRMESNAALRSELGVHKRKLRETIRHWYRSLTGRKPTGPTEPTES